MSQPPKDKSNALEAFLEESTSDTGDEHVDLSIPDQSGISAKSPEQGEAKAAEKETAPPKSQRNSRAREQNGGDDETLIERISGLTSSAFKFAKRTTSTSFKVGKALMLSQDQLKLMLSAGQSLKDLREVAGLTVSELSEALNLKDKSLLEAVENGTATLSFELILRLSALLARNDPIPFIIKYTRTYNPDIWRILSDWGLGRLPLQYERERKFINIFRAHDAARSLSDDGYKKVLEFTRKAFELSLHFIAEQENVELDANETQNGKNGKNGKNDENGKNDKRTGKNNGNNQSA